MISLDKETLIFQHIPKTGGITLSLWLLEHFDWNRVFHVRNPQHSKAPTFGRIWGTMDEFAALSEEERSHFQCVMGHMPFGIHEHIPGKARYLAVLRDPIERILSQHGQYNRMVENQEIKGGQFLSLKEYLQRKPSTLDNHQTRFLLAGGYEGKSEDERFSLVQEILANHFLLVGVLERFEETVLILNQRMGWPCIPYRRENVGSLKSSPTEISPEFSDLMRERNHLDFRVHAYAKESLTKALLSYGPTLEQDLTRLRAANEKLENPSPISEAFALVVRIVRALLRKHRSVRVSLSDPRR